MLNLPRSQCLRVTELRELGTQQFSKVLQFRVFGGPYFLVQRSFSPFAGLVAMAVCPNPIPSRTRSLNASAPMVLCLKTWESRSLPGLPKAKESVFFTMIFKEPVATSVAAGFLLLGRGKSE